MIAKNFKVAHSTTYNRYCVKTKCIYNQRRVLDQLFYKCNDLSAQELYSITRGRRLQFNQDDVNSDVQLLIHKDIWTVEEKTWQGMANILNEWSTGDQIRENAKKLKDDLFIINLTIPDYIDYE